MATHIRFTSWNRYAPRFVNPPCFTWENIDGATRYRVGVAGASQRQATWFEASEPSFNFSRIWPALSFERIDMVTIPLDASGNEMDKPSTNENFAYKAFFKSPGWKGGRQLPLDWAGAVRRNMAFLLRPATDQIEPFEVGWPRHLWSATEDSYSGERHLEGAPGALNAYPTLHFPIYISAFLEFSAAFPEDELASDAHRQAHQYVGWLLKYHHPSDYACSDFPFSCIARGELREQSPTGVENVTVFRVAAVAEVLLTLGQSSGERDYIQYALHVAEGLLRLQNDDGSWPFRVEPKTGRVLEAYTSAAITPARLMALLYKLVGDEKYRHARDRAVKWLLDNPVRTWRWEGMYEDVGPQPPYTNLQHWDVDEFIRYLVHFRDEIDGAVDLAQRLNDYVEDQFVLWETGDPVVRTQCPGPAVMEQYHCYEPMEGHTGRWILSLMALHSATGEAGYLDKAIAAANAICRQQTPSGAFTTWGYDLRFGRPLLEQYGWYAVDALALQALIRLQTYLESLAQHQPSTWPLSEFWPPTQTAG